MNERIAFRFSQNGKPVKIDQLVRVEFDVGGVVLNGETSAWPRAVRFDFEGVGLSKDVLNLLRKQTANGDHKFTVDADKGLLNFTTTLPNRIPTGSYDFRLRIADLDIENGNSRLKLKEGGNPAEVELKVRPDQRAVQVTDTLKGDKLIADMVNGSSRIDGKKIVNWLADNAPRAKRKACMLNLLAALRTIPSEDAPLIAFVEDIFLADVSRIYVKVAPEFFDLLQELDEDPRQSMKRDRLPLHPGHLKMLRRVPDEDQDVTERYSLKSFRQNAQPSVQIVVAVPPDETLRRGFYADVDIDLGNPQRDLAGFFTHLGELMSEGQTDHLKLNKKLKKDPVLGGHLHYTIV